MADDLDLDLGVTGSRAPLALTSRGHGVKDAPDLDLEAHGSRSLMALTLRGHGVKDAPSVLAGLNKGSLNVHFK